MIFLNKSAALVPLVRGVNGFFLQPVVLTAPAVRNYAARKGTRERKKNKKVKVEVEKVGFIPHNQRDKDKYLLTRPKRKFDDSKLPIPQDNVYVQKYYQWKVYSFAEAVQCHRDTHHPDMYNKPNEKLHLNIELNMIAEKKTRFVDNFTRIASIPHKFDHGEVRSIIAFTKVPEMQEEVKAAGAQMAGGVELIKEIQNGSISLQDFEFVVAHPNILPEMVSLRGLMKRKFPAPKNGTLDANLTSAVNKFLHGINYSAVKDEYEKDFALIETVIGTLNMDCKHLEENFASLIRNIYEMKPKREGSFISRCLLWSPPSGEKLKVDYSCYVNPQEQKGDISDEEEAEAVVAA